MGKEALYYRRFCTLYFAHLTNTCILGSRHCFKHFTGISSINPPNTLCGRYYHILLLDPSNFFLLYHQFIKNLNNLLQKQILLGKSHVKWGPMQLTEKEEVVQGEAARWREISSIVRGI